MKNGRNVEVWGIGGLAADVGSPRFRSPHHCLLQGDFNVVLSPCERGSEGGCPNLGQGVTFRGGHPSQLPKHQRGEIYVFRLMGVALGQKWGAVENINFEDGGREGGKFCFKILMLADIYRSSPLGLDAACVQYTQALTPCYLLGLHVIGFPSAALLNSGSRWGQ